MRLLISNQHFPEGKEGTEENEAQEYILRICKVIELDPDEISYNKLQQTMITRHS